MVILFTAASFLAATLLFTVQPLVGRMVLPAFGGSPQVWTTSMLFFQAALLGGYGYTHLAVTRIPRRIQPWLHVAVVATLTLSLPIALIVVPSGRDGLAPSLELLAALSVGVAAPFVAIATTGPLLQAWFSWTDHPRASDPYFLYAAGNAGSIAGLLAYPFLLEPLLGVTEQSRLWAAGYLSAALLLLVCAVVVKRRRVPAEVLIELTAEPSTGGVGGIPARKFGRWVLLAFVPSSMMIGATTYISTDVAAVPLLWILPLTLYLGSFVVAFSRLGPAAVRPARWLTPPVVILALTMRPVSSETIASVVVQLLLVAVVAVLGHGLLSMDRPPPRQLTQFYLALAIGGALGGLFNGIVAPLVFPTVLEHGIVAALAVALVVNWRTVLGFGYDWSLPRRVGGAVLVAGLLLAILLQSGVGTLPSPWHWVLLVAVLAPFLGRLGRSSVVGASVMVLALLPTAAQLGGAALVERTFFGVHRVAHAGEVTQLYHGTTLHGTQDQASPESRRQPLTYYHRAGPVGDLVSSAESTDDLAVIGLGTGAIAAYAADGQRIVFREIDPQVAEIARSHFTYLSDSDGDVDVVLGDGRLTLDGVTSEYRLLLVDAFSSDAIPVHLLTVEAMATYLEAITPNGIVAVHVTNRHLDLVPVMRGAAERLGAATAMRSWSGQVQGGLATTWVAVAGQHNSLEALRQQGWEDLPTRRVLWTDQRSDLLSVLK
jgi:hypothetical protein